VSALVGFAALLLGGFSRFGLWRQIFLAVLILVGLKLIDNFMNDMASKDEALWPLVYLASATGLATGYFMLWLSTRPAVFYSRRKRAAA